MKKTYSLLNLLVLIIVIFWNYYANAKGINENSVGSLSNEYANLFTPASYAFSIWALIYLGLIANAIFQLKSAFGKTEAGFITTMGPWLMIANIGNGLWIWAWLTERTGLSVIVMLVILACLLKLAVNIGINKENVSKTIKIWVWFPASLYAGWITVALVANISAYLAKIGWQGPLDESTWTVVMLLVATLIYIYVLRTRNMVTFTAVGVWAILAIMVKHWYLVPEVQKFSLICALALVVGIIYQFFGRKHSSQVKN